MQGNTLGAPIDPPQVSVSGNVINVTYGNSCSFLCTPGYFAKLQVVAPPLNAGSYVLNVAGVVEGVAQSTLTVVPTAAPNYSGLWWNPAEPGMGISIEHQGDIVVATLFMYSYSPSNFGTPLWLIMSRGEKAADGTYAGKLYSTTYSGPVPGNSGSLPVPPASGWDPSKVSVTEAGFATFKFNDLNNATVSLRIGSYSVIDSLTRELFSVPNP
ncbi:MAG TPA: hypothetical protein VH040_17785 [Usitatibacter sp.]|nr:hypothetical protein [Usitatibacter sp.]